MPPSWRDVPWLPSLKQTRLYPLPRLIFHQSTFCYWALCRFVVYLPQLELEVHKTQGFPWYISQGPIRKIRIALDISTVII